MIIEPNTSIKLLRNVPLDNSYRNTIYFDDVQTQYEHFIKYVKYSIPDNSYTRVNGGVARVGLKADNLYDCNYMMFQNSSFGNKWFYAFITKVEYVNNITATITFEIDDMQTWATDYKMRECFVEREMVTDDRIGVNLVPENFELGEYVLRHHRGTGKMDARYICIIVACTTDVDGEIVEGGYYGGVYSGLKFNKFTTAEHANNFIYNLNILGKSEAIVSVFMAYDSMWGDIDETPRLHEINVTKYTDDLDGYVPKNKKLLTSPYNVLYCTNTIGGTAEFRYEFFNSDTCGFWLVGESSCVPQVTLIPKEYKIEGDKNINEKMVLAGFPQCAYGTDAFRAWIAQNAGSTAVSSLGSALAVVGGLATGNPAVAAGGVMGALGVIAQINKASIRPPQANGNSGAGNTYAYGELDFHFFNATITAEFARILDENLSCYGYAVHRVKVPNRNTRPHWNYVKTINSSLTGSVPADSLRKLMSIYDKGVTFWKHTSTVGDYSQDNSIL